MQHQPRQKVVKYLSQNKCQHFDLKKKNPAKGVIRCHKKKINKFWMVFMQNENRVQPQPGKYHPVLYTRITNSAV